MTQHILQKPQVQRDMESQPLGARKKPARHLPKSEWHRVYGLTTSLLLWVVLLEAGLAKSLEQRTLLGTLLGWAALMLAAQIPACRNRLPLHQFWFYPEIVFACMFASPGSVFFLLFFLCLRSLAVPKANIFSGENSRSHLLHTLGLHRQHRKPLQRQLPYLLPGGIFAGTAAAALLLRELFPSAAYTFARLLLLGFCVLWTQLFLTNLRENENPRQEENFRGKP